MKAKNSKTHLCDSCTLTYPECPSENLNFGDGFGNDNIIGCDSYIQIPECIMEDK